MIGVFLLATSSVLAAPDSPPSSPDHVLKVYESISRDIGRSSEEQLKLALWCEQNGLKPEREKHLAMAILADPENVVARGLLGQIQDDGKWRSAVQIAAGVDDDPKRVAVLNQYKGLRDKTPHRAEAQWKLALWCEKNGLEAEARAHFHAVLRLEPNHELARKRLGYVRYGGQWATDSEVAAIKQESEAQHKADLHWTHELEALSAKLAHSRSRDDVERRISSISDPRAVGAIMHVLGRSRQSLAAQLLGQIDSPEATKALALLAVHAKAGETRRVAAETLVRRDPRDYVGLLISFVQDTTDYSVKAVPGQNSPGELVVDGPSAVMHRVYQPTAPRQVTLMAGDFIQYDQYGLPVISRYVGSLGANVPLASGTFNSPEDFARSEDQVQKQIVTGLLGNASVLQGTPVGSSLANAVDSAAANQVQQLERSINAQSADRVRAGTPWNVQGSWASYARIQSQFRILIPVGEMYVATLMANEQLQAKLAADIMQIDLNNLSVAQANDRVLPILQATTGQSLGADQKAWKRWWTDFQGYSISQSPSKPEFYNVVQASAPVIQPVLTSVASITNGTAARVGHSCFGGGTPVRTPTGQMPIETLQVGDLVLSSDVTTGELQYAPVVAVHHNPPAETFRVDLGTDSLVATGIHRLWKAGKGWVMTRELKPGDVLRTVDGTAVVKSVTREKVQPVFNLEVADGHDFFVGRANVLAHDNSLIRPVTDPFDASADLVAAIRP